MPPLSPRGRPPWGSLAVLAALCLAGLGMLALTAWLSHGEALSATERELRLAAVLLSEEADRSLVRAEARQAELAGRIRAEAIASAEELRAWAGSPAIQRWLAEAAISVFDGQRRMLAPGASLADALPAEREALGAIAGGAPRFLGAAVPDAAGGAWTLLLARPLAAPGGGLLGAAIGRAELPRPAAIQGESASPAQVSLSVLRADGTRLAGDPSAGAGNGPPAGDRAMLAATHGLPAQALEVRAEASRDAALAGWRARMAGLGGAMLLLPLLGALAGAATWRRASAEAAARATAAAAARDADRMAGAAQEERQRHRRELSAHVAAFEATLECMSLALLTFGRHARLTFANGRCAEMLGVPLEALRPGATLAQLIAAAREAGQDRAAEVLQRLLPFVVRRDAASFRHDLDQVRTLLVVHRPLADGGWLATFEDVTGQRAAEQRHAAILQQDALTGLPNLAALRERLASLLPLQAAGGGRVALLHLNLARFRAVNEALGYRVGDSLLRAVAGRLSRQVRVRTGHDILARAAADEFVLVAVPSPSLRGDPAAEAASIAERLADSLGRPFEIEGYRILTGAAIGIALYPAGGETADELLRNAALAMRFAKGAGPYRFFTPDMAIEAQSRRLLELDLRQALMEGAASAFEIHGEPILDSRSRHLVGIEASLRWQHQVHGLLPGETLTALAEELDVVRPLGRLALWRACTEARNWPAELRIALRLSVAQLLDPGLAERAAATLAETGLGASRLEVMVPAGELRHAPSAALDTMRRLRSLGVRLTLDDLGAEAGAPAALRAFAFDGARLARPLVAELGGRSHGLEMTRALVALCARHGTPVSAAGVETEEQVELLAAERCWQVQGPLFGPVARAADLAASQPAAAGSAAYMPRSA